MKERILPKLPDLEPEFEATDTWHIENYRSMTRKERGPKFECGGHPWYAGLRMLATSKGISTDGHPGEYCSSLTAITLTMPPYTSSKHTKMTTNRKKAGTPVCSLP